MNDIQRAREKRAARELASGQWSAASVRRFKRWETRSGMPDTRSPDWADFMTWLAEELPGSEFHWREQAQLLLPCKQARLLRPTKGLTFAELMDGVFGSTDGEDAS